MHIRGVKTATAILIVVSLGMAAFIAYKFSLTSESGPIESAKVVIPSNVKEYDARAFINIVRSAASVQRGTDWKAEYETNSWARCSIELYGPDGILSDTLQNASTTLIWNVPSDAEPGKWIARFLCGADDNLAAVDRRLVVR